MENENAIRTASNANNTILGTSSDAIIEGLHNGSFSEPISAEGPELSDDKNQIVNQQDQNAVINMPQTGVDDKLPSGVTENTAIAGAEEAVLFEDDKRDDESGLEPFGTEEG